MRLSDAIATGRVLLIPTVHYLVTPDGSGGCALGMALRAMGETRKTMIKPSFKIFDIVVDEGGEDYTLVSKYWPWTDAKAKSIPCIETCQMEEGDDMQDLIVHIFDSHVGIDWTLDQLIDWVRSVEPEEPLPLREVDVAVKREGVEV
jgi:hypothetical protein